MDSNLDNLKISPNQQKQKQKNTFSYIYTHAKQNKTKQRGFSPSQLTTQLNTMTYQTVGFGMLLFVTRATWWAVAKI
jgi:hypothetical protein